MNVRLAWLLLRRTHLALPESAKKAVSGPFEFRFGHVCKRPLILRPVPAEGHAEVAQKHKTYPSGRAFIIKKTKCVA
jgi:membrane-associated phospholipid phosphatase